MVINRNYVQNKTETEIDDGNQIDSTKKNTPESHAMVMPQDINLDLNLRGHDEFAPIHAACSVGNEQAVHYLLF